MKGIVYYTCNTHKPEIDELCRKQLAKINLPIVSVSLNKDLDFGDIRLKTEGQRSPLTMHKQIVMGLEATKTKYVFMAESDVLYHPSHFDFKPLRNDVYYFNVNVWKMRWSDGFCVRTDNSQQVSGMLASRKLLLDYFSNRVVEIEKNGFDNHYEPRNKPRINYESLYPNICIRHGGNLTRSKWSVNDFRKKRFAWGWKESTIDKIVGWNIKEMLI